MLSIGRDVNWKRRRSLLIGRVDCSDSIVPIAVAVDSVVPIAVVVDSIVPIAVVVD